MRKKLVAGFVMFLFIIIFAGNKGIPEKENEHVHEPLVKESSTVKAASMNATGPLSGLNIALDAGHGGFDGGAVGPTGLLEKDSTLRTVSILKELLEKEGATVLLTRERDEFLSLDTRVQLVGYGRAHLLISVHADGYENSEAKGITTYYYDHHSEALAQSIHESIFSEAIETENRGIAFGNFQVLRDTFVPAVLLELGYITNPEDELLLQSDSFQQLVSRQIVQGIMNHQENLRNGQKTMTETAEDITHTIELR